MKEIRRREFLKGSGAAIAAAGVVATMPLMPAVINALDSEAPEADGAVASSSEAALTMSQPLIVRVNDLSSGAMQLFYGDQEVAHSDPQLAARLFRAAQ
jgi:hypothetical protein